MRPIRFFAALVIAMSASVADAASVVFETSAGSFEIRLFADESPKTVENFLHYVNSGFYDGLIFHRVIPGFMVQGGGFVAPFDPRKKPKAATRPPVTNESENGILNLQWTVAMARTADPDSATSQFFINVADNHFLNYKSGQPGYAVFGKLVAGQDVVTEIVGLQRYESVGQFDNVPAEPPVIIKAAYKP